MATQPQQPDNALPVPPGAPETAEPVQERELLPGEPEGKPVPASGVSEPTQEQQDYWEKILSGHNLSMERAGKTRVSKKDRRIRTVHVGDSSDLEKIPQRTDIRRNHREGHGPDE